MGVNLLMRMGKDLNFIAARAKSCVFYATLILLEHLL